MDWLKPPATTEPLTREVFEEGLRRIANAPPDPCSLGRHVVSATALREGWEWARCANCYRPVRLNQEGAPKDAFSREVGREMKPPEPGT